MARVAYLTSDVVLSVQPALQTDSVFSKSLKALRANKTEAVSSKRVPEVRLNIHDVIVLGVRQDLTCGVFEYRW